MSIDISLEQQLHDLRQRVEGLEARVLHVPVHTPEPALDPALEAKAIAITREFFSRSLASKTISTLKSRIATGA